VVRSVFTRSVWPRTSDQSRLYDPCTYFPVARTLCPPTQGVRCRDSLIPRGSQRPSPAVHPRAEGAVPPSGILGVSPATDRVRRFAILPGDRRSPPQDMGRPLCLRAATVANSVSRVGPVHSQATGARFLSSHHRPPASRAAPRPEVECRSMNPPRSRMQLTARWGIRGRP